MKRIWLCVTLFACGGDDAPVEPLPVGNAEATITHYDYAFDLTTRAAHAKLTAVLDTPGNCVTLPLRADGFDPATVLVDGAPAEMGTRVDGGNAIACGAGRQAGATMTIDADVVVPLRTLEESQVGYSITDDAAGNPFHYLVSWVGGCDRFGPCDNRPDRFARYTFRVTHPAELRVMCSGTIVEDSATQTTCTFDHDGGPTYSTFGFAAYPRSAWVETPKGAWGSANVTLFDRPETGIDDRIDPAYHAGFVAWMESTFGPYPYGDELRIVTAPTYWSGFEHPGNIVLDDLLARGQSLYLRPVAHVLDHEIAHQWAGDQTTLASTYDFVWKEAMAEYLAYVYEDIADREAAPRTVNAWKSYSVGARYFPVPGEQPPLFDYYGDVYGPGPMILFRQIEAMSSREQVIAALQTVLGAQRALSVDDVLAALEASTGLDLGAYAAAWIRGTGAPVWPTVRLSYMVGDATDFLRVEHVAGVERTCKFHVLVKGATAAEQLLVPVDLREGADQTIPIQPQPTFTVTATELDPLRECIVLPATTALVAPHALRHPWLSPRVVLPHEAKPSR